MLELHKDLLCKSYFESQCEKHGFKIKYIRYLHPTMINFILTICCIRLGKKQLIHLLNQNEDLYCKYTPHYFDKKIMTIRRKLNSLELYAEIFGISQTIVPLSADQLHDLVDDYYVKEKEEC